MNRLACGPGADTARGEVGSVALERRTMSRRPHASSGTRVLLGGLAAALGALVVPAVALAHGDAPSAPTWPGVLGDWSFDPTVAVPLAIAAALYIAAVRSVDRAHVSNRVPRRRVVAFLAGLVAIEIALQSPIERFDTTLFSVHMIQHILLMFVAAPLLALGAPITLLLRVVRPEVRTRFVLPILHSRVVRVVSFPVVSWIVFTAVMWGTHFSPWFDAALEDPLVHQLEHATFLAAALLFWWPVVGLDPSPWRMPYPVRALYTFLQMPQNTFLSLAIFSATEPLYEHYATLERTWGPTPLADQQAAGAIMWVLGDLTFVSALVLLVVAWMRAEERMAAANDARVAREEAALQGRADRLADRLRHG
jgi:putative membrane protein